MRKSGKAGMDNYVKMGVKSLIETIPEVGQILERYEIGCVSCEIGTCELGDVVKFHALPSQNEVEMMSRIGEVIHLGGNTPQPQVRQDTEPPGSPKGVYTPLTSKIDSEERASQ